MRIATFWVAAAALASSSVARLAAQEPSEASRAISASTPPPPSLENLHREATDTPECRVRQAEDFVPMSDNERLMTAIKSAVGPDVWLDSALHAAWGEALDRPDEWKTHFEGYAKRWGSAYAEHFIGQAIQHSIAYGLHEDNRYFASGQRGFGRRLAYVLESTVLARHDDGTRFPSVSGIGGAAAAAFISRVWQPPSVSTPGDAAVSFGLILATRALRNGIHEFAPRAVSRFWQ